MRRLYQAGALAALGVGLGATPVAVGCWGEQFTAAPAGGLGGASSASGASGPSVAAGGGGGTLQTTSTTGGEGCGTVTVMADADTYVDGMYADDNYDHKALSDDELKIYQFGITSKRILIFFDVQFWVPEGYAVQWARLELVIAEYTRDFGAVDVHKITLPESTARPPWDERFVTWNRYTGESLWAAPGGDFDPTPSASTPMEGDWPMGTVVSWDVTADVQQFYAGAANAGWLLKETNDPNDGLGIGYVFFGRESEVVLMEPEEMPDATVPDAGSEPGAPGAEPAPAMPDPTTTDTATTTATTGDAAGGTTSGTEGTTGGTSTGGMDVSDAGASDADMEEDDGPGVHPRLLVYVCPA